MVKRVVALAICVGLFPVCAAAQSHRLSKVNFEQVAQPSGMTVEQYQWAQEYDRARVGKGRGKMWMIVGGAMTGVGLIIGASSNSAAKGVVIAGATAPGLVIGGMGYLGYRGATNRMRDLDARKPKSEATQFGSAPLSLSYRFTW